MAALPTHLPDISYTFKYADNYNHADNYNPRMARTMGNPADLASLMKDEHRSNTFMTEDGYIDTMMGHTL